MGFFKKLGKSLKSVTKGISLKNVVKVATGRAGEVANEFKDRALGEFTKTSSGTANRETVADVVNDAVTNYTTNVADQSLKNLWDKYKKYVLIGAGVLTLGLIFIFRRGGRSKSRF